MLTTEVTNVLAAGVLLAALLGLIAWAVVVSRRFIYTPAQLALFAWNFSMARVVWRAKISGRLPIGPGQGAVIVCNHRSGADPAFIALAVNRPVHWMVAKEFCENRAFGWFLRICEVIPVGRGGIDTAATKGAIRCASEGGLVGLFPEGRINTTDQLLLPGRPGAAMIALNARVPVVPCYVSGSPYDGTVVGCLFMGAKVQLEVGEPIDLTQYYCQQRDREVLKALTRRFMSEIAKLAGHGDFQPQLAGRFYKPGATGN